ncbi:anti-sigma factor [Thioalkalivibrio sp.]|uniref:DsrE family protein n=1 Tax=Thioalkalivibrio sp. TaxID=2093813 RepID=UPI0012D59E13|nr:anti-sigma factor [Thioalkalivibrio sp.]TVP81538.1 MAG: anti-sigma factor [Thioalkalivibrio sp.]
MSDTRPSDEILNAFVDGEFSSEDRLLTLKSIAASENLSREVCDMYQLKELVNMAYSQGSIPDPKRRPLRKRGRLGGGLIAIAASVVALALGTVAVLEVSREQSVDLQQVALVSQERDSAAGGEIAPVTDVRRVLFHVTDVDLRDAEALFDDIEHMFETAWLNDEQLQVQMVLHGTGMDLVRADLAPFPNRIRDLVHTYDGLRVTACGQSRARHEREEGRPVQLLPWVEEVESGVREAAQKQQEGWTYIRV